MKKYEINLEIHGTIHVDAKNDDSAFNKAIMHEKRLTKLLKENGFDGYDAICIKFEEAKEDE